MAIKLSFVVTCIQFHCIWTGITETNFNHAVLICCILVATSVSILCWIMLICAESCQFCAESCQICAASFITKYVCLYKYNYITIDCYYVLEYKCLNKNRYALCTSVGCIAVLVIVCFLDVHVLEYNIIPTPSPTHFRMDRKQALLMR